MAEKSATPTGVELSEAEKQDQIDAEALANDQKPELENEPEKPQLDRDVMMKDLAAKRSKELAGETDDPEDDEVDPKDTPVGDPDPNDPPQNQMVEIKVYGRIIHKTQEEVDAAGGIAAIQKALAGDVKLEQAADERKKLEVELGKVNDLVVDNAALRTELTELRQTIEQQEETPEELKQRAKEIAEKFFKGDPEELEAALEQLLSIAHRPAPVAAVPPAPQVDEAAITQRVRDGLKFDESKLEAKKFFQAEHGDLDTEHRRGYVNDRTKEIIREKQKAGESWTPVDVMTEAVERTRTQLGILKPAAPKVKTALEKKRATKKQSVDRIPQAHERVPPAPDKNKPKTKQEIFDEMNAKRSHA